MDKTIGSTEGGRVGRTDAASGLPAESLHAQKMEAIGQLAGGVAHDLSNLMTAIFGWLEVANSQLPTKHEARGALEMVDRAARQAVGLTRSLLTFSHQACAEKRRIRLDDVVRDTSRMLARLLPAAIEQRTSLGTGAIWIDGDATQIQQVVMNLALNARDAMPAGGTLTIELSASTGADGPEACLRVRDTGCGIAESARSRIFEPFYSTKEREHGTGLGLAIVHAIAADHGARVELESEVGGGSTFSVAFPVASSAEADTRGAPPEAGANSSGGCILIVEDNALVRAMLTTVFVDAGYQVVEAGDGAEGRKVFGEHRDVIDVAVVDLDLPKVNGLDVLESLLAARPGLSAIAMTGYPLPERGKGRLNELGCALLNKPFKVPEIKRLVASMLREGRS